MYAVEERIPARKSKDIYEWVRRQGGTLSKQELLERSGLTPSTLTRILEELTLKELLTEVGFGLSTGGRRPILYRTNPQYAYAFGLEISRTRSMLVLTDMHHHIVSSTVWRMSESYSPDSLLAEVAASAAYMLESRGIERRQVLGFGVGAVGPVDTGNGRILNPLYFRSSGWNNVRVKERLETALGVCVYLDNGANAALTGEYWADPVKRKHLLYVHVGAGLRSAMMTGGSIVYGAVDMEGAVGQMIVEAGGIPHREARGNRGALESYVSIHALEREWRRLGRTGGFQELLACLEREEAAAVSLLERSGRYFGIGLANLLNTLHPEKVILGGPVVNAHPAFFRTAVSEALRGAYYYGSVEYKLPRQPERSRKRETARALPPRAVPGGIHSPVAYRVEFHRGELGEAAIAVGAAIMVVNRLTM
ncbi:MAG: family transcriptional regulator [Paenibacillaceae bacterium]|jgi:predicted NBD/HSP70 family sugar kinase|nr:family transcriptional regulator [Paenibacillaceae bacterium]